MKLFNEVIYVISETFGLKVRIPRPDIQTIVCYLDMRNLISAEDIVKMIVEDLYFIEDSVVVSPELGYVLDCVGPEWIKTHKGSAIEMIKVMCDCDEHDANTAVDLYLKKLGA